MCTDSMTAAVASACSVSATRAGVEKCRGCVSRSSRLHSYRRLNFTPTSSSWPNLVECRFALITDRASDGRLRQRGKLRTAIRLWATHYNDDPKPCVWTQAADKIIEKVRRGRSALDQIESATDG